MTKSEIADYIVSTTVLSRSQAIDAVEGFIKAVSNSLCKGEAVYLRGFATIKPYTTKARKGRNITKGVEVHVPERRKVKLILGKNLKSALNNGK